MASNIAEFAPIYLYCFLPSVLVSLSPSCLLIIDFQRGSMQQVTKARSAPDNEKLNKLTGHWVMFYDGYISDQLYYGQVPSIMIFFLHEVSHLCMPLPGEVQKGDVGYPIAIAHTDRIIVDYHGLFIVLSTRKHAVIKAGRLQALIQIARL
eukprot:6202101-Pleurochrysis_carterae.AAC.1